DDPAGFKARTGHKQVVDELGESSKFSWMEPYCWVTACDRAVLRRLTKLRPVGSYRLGGNMSELFAAQPAQPSKTSANRRK
ncbi:MAG: hypothetical protein HYZ32_00770, partial [Hydrocarboniphaga effusa]|nr:hypothetical protein [Hydrocarboniphaga effusa]